jgi:endonuclease/exonuclease/phosphatase family metal-dependent hydrolase
MRVRILLIILIIILLCYIQSRFFSVKRALKLIERSSIREIITSIDSDRLKVCSYNIAHCRGGKEDASNWSNETLNRRIQRINKIAEQIKRQNCDVVVLNEVDFESTWSHNIDQSIRIADIAGYPYILQQRNYDVKIPFISYRFGNVIMSKYPISKASIVNNPPYSIIKSVVSGNHNSVFCIISVKNINIGILAVHLDSRSEYTRVLFAEIISHKYSKHNIPIILVGDFNSTPSSYPNSIITADGLNAMDLILSNGFLHKIPSPPAIDYCTFSSERPHKIIDWILVSPNIDIISYKVINSDLSDHFMITANILLNNKTN